MAKQESWQEREKRERLQAEQGLRVACKVLQRLGVATVEARYDGAGDEGWIQEVRYDPSPPAGLPEGLQPLIEAYVGTRLPPGWEINAGSSGKMTIDVNTRAARLDHHWKEDDEYGGDELEDFEDDEEADD
jgi:hypothetical protein